MYTINFANFNACVLLTLLTESLEVMLEKLEQAKADNETIKVSYTTVVFSGSSGVGKTTLFNKLNKQELNRRHHSTGVAKSKHTICIKTTAVVKSTEGLQWVNLDYDSMISYLNKHLRNLQFPVSSLSEASSPPEETTPIDLDNKLSNPQVPLVSSTAAASSLKEAKSKNIPKNQQSTIDSTKVDLVAVDIAKANSSNIPSLGDVWDIINFLDTGGQPEFVNILPAVSSSIALAFIVFNLTSSLDGLVRIQHNVNGDPSFKPYDLDCTNLEFIKRLMISSENFNKNISSPLESIQREDGENDSKICYIGTHALNVKEEKIKEIDSQLSSVANDLELHERTFWCSPQQNLERLFPIDFFPDEEELFEEIIEDIRDRIQRQVQRRDYYEVPITWLIFLLKLQKLCHMNNVSYISYRKAVDVWMNENVSEDELGDQSLHEDQHESVSREESSVYNILLFFHFMGMLFYYHKVKGICDFVFIDRQWLFEKLTELVEIKFTKGYSKKNISAEDVQRFTTEGRLNINIIKNLKINLQGIQPLYFIHLLDHLNIVAPIDTKNYFMPCVLPSYPSSERCIDLDEFYGIIQRVPLLVGFKNGPMPHGFFCHLIVELFRNLPEGWVVPFLSTQGIQHAYNNLITFHTTSGHAVSIFYKIGHLEVQVRRKSAQSTVIHFDVKQKLDKVLRKACKNIQLNNELLCYGFYCKCKERHFAKLQGVPSQYIFCKFGRVEITKDYKAWLQVYSCNSSHCYSNCS